MGLKVDLFWSFRSPYSYLATPRLRELGRDYDVDLEVRPVLPIAVRIDGFFQTVNDGCGQTADGTGFNADEASAFPGYGKVTAEQFREIARQRYGESVDAFLELYPAGTDEAAGSAQKTSQRDMAAVALGRLAAERGRTAKTDAYLYYFERSIPWPEHPEFGAFHTAEVPYVFNNLAILDRPWEAVDRELADAVSSYWANFAARGDPNGDGLPTWPAYEAAPHAVMVLGESIGPRQMPADDARRAFFDAQLGKD